MSGLQGEPESQPQPKPKKRYKIEPAPGGKLEQLLIANKDAHDQNTTAKEAETEAKMQIKAFLLSLFPGGAGMPDAFDIAGDPHGRYPGYTMTLRTGKRFDVNLAKEHMTQAYYESFEVEITPSWDLREATHGRRY